MFACTRMRQIKGEMGHTEIPVRESRQAQREKESATINGNFLLMTRITHQVGGCEHEAELRHVTLQSAANTTHWFSQTENASEHIGY